MQSTAPESAPAAARRLVFLGTGGTIAGTAASATDPSGYTAAQLGVEQLVRSVPALQAHDIEVEQVAQLDSKDMDFAVWRVLAARVSHHLARADVAGIVITHGTDTLEESGYFLQQQLAPAKPVVLTAAMRPATSIQADGPQNLLDAAAVASAPGAAGVLAVVAGAVWRGDEVRKTHTFRLDAFGAGDSGPVAWVERGQLRALRDWPRGAARKIALPADDAWPRVEIVTSHAGADGRIVDALVADGVEALVVACTGGGTVHEALESALLRAQSKGVPVLRASRVPAGTVVMKADDVLPAAGTLTPVQARVELMLQLLARRASKA